MQRRLPAPQLLDTSVRLPRGGGPLLRLHPRQRRALPQEQLLGYKVGFFFFQIVANQPSQILPDYIVFIFHFFWLLLSFLNAY